MRRDLIHSLAFGAVQGFRSGHPLLLQRRQAARKNGDSPISVTGCPSSNPLTTVHLPVPLLPGGVQDFTQQRLAVLIFLGEDAAGDLIR